MDVHEFTVKRIKSYPNIRDHIGAQPSSVIFGTAFREQECWQKKMQSGCYLCKVTAVLQALTSLKNKQVEYRENLSCNRRFLSAELSGMPSHRRFSKSMVNFLINILKQFRKVIRNHRLLEV